MDKILENRYFMKSVYGEYDVVGSSDIAKGIPQPLFQKEVRHGQEILILPTGRFEEISSKNLYQCISNRISRRSYSDIPVNIDQLSFLLWTTQGLKKVIGGYRDFIKDGSGRNYLRNVPAGGCLYSYDTYIAVINVDGIKKGVWRYLPLNHAMALENEIPNIDEKVSDAFTNKSQNQSFAAKAGIAFFWVCNPYIGEWRYNETAHKIMLIDVGHISQQLYLSAEAIDLGCCVIGGYKQNNADLLIGVDGINEFTVLCAAVGNVNEEERNWVDKFPDARENPDFYEQKDKLPF